MSARPTETEPMISCLKRFCRNNKIAELYRLRLKQQLSPHDPKGVLLLIGGSRASP